MADLEQLVPRLGGLAWISAEMFALEGRWAADMAEPEAVVHLAEHSRHHGWHSTLWRDSLPDSPALDAQASVVAPEGWADGFETAAGLEGDTARLAALYRVLVPRLSAELDALADQLDGPGDRAIQRVLGFVRSDVDSDLRGGSDLLAATLGGQETSETAASATKTLDQAFRT